MTGGKFGIQVSCSNSPLVWVLANWHFLRVIACEGINLTAKSCLLVEEQSFWKQLKSGTFWGFLRISGIWGFSDTNLLHAALQIKWALEPKALFKHSEWYFESQLGLRHFTQILGVPGIHLQIGLALHLSALFSDFSSNWSSISPSSILTIGSNKFVKSLFSSGFFASFSGGIVIISGGSKLTI